MRKFVVCCFDQHTSERCNPDSSCEKDHRSGIVGGQDELSEWTFEINCRPDRHFFQHAFKGGVPKTCGNHELFVRKERWQGSGLVYGHLDRIVKDSVMRDR